MITDNLIELFDNDLSKLIDELNAFDDEDKLWLTPGEVNNSAGNLTMHLIGNLNHFVGAVLGATGYVRDREAEFISKDMDRDEMIAEIKNLQVMLKKVLPQISESLSEIYPVEVFGKPMTTAYFLQRLYGHFNYHLGQISYLRRIL